MQRWLVWVVALAGCTAPGVPDVEDPPCPTLPDGRSMDCTITLADLFDAVAVAAEAPTPDEGWWCTLDHDDDAPDSFYRLYAHQDGRLGWEWRTDMAGTVALLSMGIVGPDDDQHVQFPFQPEGFAAIPEPPAGSEGEAYFNARALVLDQYVDGAWEPVDATMLVDTMDGVPYFVWRWHDGESWRLLDIMQEDDGPIAWRPVSRLLDDGDLLVSAATSSATIDFSQDYWLWPRAAFNDCLSDQVGA